MLQIPTHIWNQIAQEKSLKSDWAKKVFPLDQDKMLQDQEEEGDKLEEKGHSNKVILSFQHSRPLLLERQAIEDFMNRNQMPDLTPTFQTPKEAVILMNEEYRLTEEDQTSLEILLEEQISQTNDNSK